MTIRPSGKPIDSIMVTHGAGKNSWGRDYTPDEEVYPDGTPERRGCPADSDLTMKKMDELLGSSNKKMMLWIVS